MTTPQDGYTSFASKALFSGLNPTSSAAEAYLFGLNSSSSQPETPNSQLINQVLSLFKGCITSQLEEKDKLLEETAKIGKKASAIKFKGNGKQFELNSHSNSILTQIEGSVENSSEVLKLVAEGKQLIKESQKLIKIADRNKEGWLVV